MEQNKFTVADSSKLKGIAIILMLMHHLFTDASFCESYGVVYSLISADMIRKISWFGKECVAIFAFISAYGVTLNYIERNGNDKWFVDRIFKLYKGYWFVYIIALIIAILSHYNPYQCGNAITSILYGIIDFFGFNNVFGTPSLNGAWWYMEIAVEIVVVVPVAIKLYNKFGICPTLIFTLVMPKVLGVNYAALPADGNNSFIAFFMIIMLGVACARYDIVNKIIAYFEGLKNVSKVIMLFTNTTLLFVCFQLYITLPIGQFYDINYGLIPLFLIIWCRLYLLNIPILSQVLSFLGKHSMNIFLVHIFIRSVYAQDITYGFKYWELILLFLLVSSIIISILLEMVKKAIKYDKIIDKICNKICKSAFC